MIAPLLKTGECPAHRRASCREQRLRISTTGEMKKALSTSASSSEDSAKKAPMLLAIRVRRLYCFFFSAKKCEILFWRPTAFGNGNQARSPRPSEIAIYSAQLPAPSRPFHEHIRLNFSFVLMKPFSKLLAVKMRRLFQERPFRAHGKTMSLLWIYILHSKSQR